MQTLKIIGAADKAAPITFRCLLLAFGYINVFAVALDDDRKKV
jgi:hypothetical protein